MPAGISFMRSEVTQLRNIWFLVRDAIEGAPAVKGEFGCRGELYTEKGRNSQARKYLPQPNPTDQSAENKARYEQYVRRAHYYNFSKRTMLGLVGQVFLRPPVVKKPKELDMLDNNADGNGLQLVQVAGRTVKNTLCYGRSGLFVDYPQVQGTLTVQQQKDQNVQPTIISYLPWQITNWATKVLGGIRVLSLVVIEEQTMEEVDDYAVEIVTRYRALRLDKTTGNYTVEIHESDGASGTRVNGAKNYTIKSKTVPTDANGNPFKVIPFTFVGSEANDPEPDESPMYDLCDLNISHYRNSADYEESCFMVGQPTPVISGVTKYWVDTVLKGKIELGSRASISLPEGGTATLLQAKENSMPMEAMKAKQDQAVALGAKLVQSNKTTRTATEVVVDTTSESSTLSNIANNVSAAMEQCLRWSAAFVGADVTDAPAQADETGDDGVIQYTLNTEFELTRMSANDRLALIKIWQSGAICFEEMRQILKIDGVASMDDEEALENIQDEQAQAALLGGATIADPLQAVAPTAPENTPPDPVKPAVPPAKKPRHKVKTPTKKAA